MNFTNNYERIQDGQILLSMRNDGMSDADARELLETFSNKKYSEYEWSEIQYHADMADIHNTEKYDNCSSN